MTAAEFTETSIPIRRPSFQDPLEGLPKHFMIDENIVASYFMAYLSGLFPAGEDYFVRSVRAFRNEITDPQLKKNVTAFTGQEAIHGREHRELNERLADLGFRTRQIDKAVNTILSKRTERSSPYYNLAVTAAIEHFTAVMGEILLDTDLDEYIGHEGIKSLFLWHALEECEHKAVAFDVYRYVGGTEKTRRRAMNEITFSLFSSTITHLVINLILDPQVRKNPRRFWRELKVFWGAPLFRRSTWEKLRAYNAPDFTPVSLKPTIW